MPSSATPADPPDQIAVDDFVLVSVDVDRSPGHSPGKASLRSDQTPSAHTRSSDNSMVVVFGQKEWEVPKNPTYVQSPSYEQRLDDFRGRKSVLLEMDKVLLPTSPSRSRVMPKTCIICGPGGIGKTQTATHYFHTRRHKFDVAFWVQATSRDNLVMAFSQIADKLQIHNRSATRSQASSQQDESQVIEWLRNPIQSSVKRSRHLTWLLVFDGVDLPLVLEDFWPRNAPGSVVVTTRDPMMASAAGYENAGINLGAM